MTFDDSDPSRRHRTVSWTDIEIVKAYAAKEDYLPLRRKPSFSIARRGTDVTAIYTPNPGFVGSDSFSYLLSDGQGGSAVGAVSMFSAMQLAVILCRPMISNPARTTA